MKSINRFAVALTVGLALVLSPVATAQSSSSDLSANIEELRDVYTNLRVGDEQVAQTEAELAEIEARLEGLLETRFLNIQEASRLGDQIQFGIEQMISNYSYVPGPSEPNLPEVPVEPETPVEPEAPVDPIFEPLPEEEPIFDPGMPVEPDAPVEPIIEPSPEEVVTPEEPAVEPEAPVEVVEEETTVVTPVAPEDFFAEPTPEDVTPVEEPVTPEEVVEPSVDPAPVTPSEETATEEVIETGEVTDAEVVVASAKEDNKCWLLAPVRWTKSGAGWVWDRLT